MRRDFVERNGIVLPYAAPADDLAIGVGHRDRILPAEVPDVARAAEGRQRIHEEPQPEEHAEGRSVVDEIDDEPFQPADAEAVDEHRIGHGLAAHEVARLEDRRAHESVDPYEQPVDRVSDRQFAQDPELDSLLAPPLCRLSRR
jgi:hypothetical protein